MSPGGGLRRVILLLAVACGGGCGARPAAPPPEPNEQDHPGLHNLLRVSERIYSGGEPEGDAGFASLARLGVRTVVSVDGARPDVEAARRHGLSYVHIPIGYDGISERAGAALARVVRERAGPIYVHCHHGQHRGPAAAAVACIASGAADAQAARNILERAGTGREYAGLWRDVEGYEPPPPGAALPELAEVAVVQSLAAAMARIDRSHDRLRLCRDAAWSVPVDHPDVVPAREALQMEEGLREALRNLSADRDETFRKWLAESGAAARVVKDALNAGDREAAGRHFLRLEDSCKQCHRRYRN
jgi:protein tyrosine phosphatase (PTP) superfamily phosphohydrolase (DUF442 family)